MIPPRLPPTQGFVAQGEPPSASMVAELIFDDPTAASLGLLAREIMRRRMQSLGAQRPDMLWNYLTEHPGKVRVSSGELPPNVGGQLDFRSGQLRVRPSAVGGISPEEFLAHELGHALYYMSGRPPAVPPGMQFAPSAIAPLVRHYGINLPGEGLPFWLQGRGPVGVREPIQVKDIPLLLQTLEGWFGQPKVGDSESR